MKELCTLRDFLRFALSEFGRKPINLGHGTDSLWDEALALVFGGVNLPPDGDARLLDARLTVAERSHLVELVRKRVDYNIPTPYLTGVSWYAGLPFYVDERVLIPRSPIFELIANNFEPYLVVPDDRPLRFLDLCTGSGCLGIATGLNFTGSLGVLSDFECGACQVAQRNVAFHGLELFLDVIQSDGFGALDSEQFDLIICNPPYVNQEELLNLPAEYRYEPLSALASGEDGLVLVRRLLGQAFNWLTDKGVMILEVGDNYALLDKEITSILDRPVCWISFECEGYGVCALSKTDLDALYLRF